MLKALWLTVRNHNTNLFCFSNFYDIEMSTGSTSQTFFGLSSDHNMTYIIVGAVVLGFLIIIFIIFIVITVILLRLYFNSIIYSEIMVLMSNFPPRFYCFPNFLPQRWSSGWEREGRGEVWEGFKSTKTSGRKRINRKRTKYNNNDNKYAAPSQKTERRDRFREFS